ncbi:hypothetical protein TgHK011_008969 [Trichoderma gracile]|nr:hypothetical protein TgHK011_008969 [Trichoderma gracile]
MRDNGPRTAADGPDADAAPSGDVLQLPGRPARRWILVSVLLLRLQLASHATERRPRPSLPTTSKSRKHSGAARLVGTLANASPHSAPGLSTSCLAGLLWPTNPSICLPAASVLVVSEWQASVSLCNRRTKLLEHYDQTGLELRSCHKHPSTRRVRLDSSGLLLTTGIPYHIAPTAVLASIPGKSTPFSSFSASARFIACNERSTACRGSTLHNPRLSICLFLLETRKNPLVSATGSFEKAARLLAGVVHFCSSRY